MKHGAQRHGEINFFILIFLVSWRLCGLLEQKLNKSARLPITGASSFSKVRVTVSF